MSSHILSKVWRDMIGKSFVLFPPAVFVRGERGVFLYFLMHEVLPQDFIIRHFVPLLWIDKKKGKQDHIAQASPYTFVFN